MTLVKEGKATKVVLLNDIDSYIEGAYVKLYDNNMVHIEHADEETTMHLYNCEIIWKLSENLGKPSNVRLLKTPKDEKTSDSE